MKINKDLRNILLGLIFLLIGWLLAYKVHIDKTEGIEAIIIQVSPIFPLLLGFHFLGKSFDYHLKCYQIKHRRAIREKEDNIKSNKNEQSK